jgi:GNAT superfamily N-acetyltransferase
VSAQPSAGTRTGAVPAEGHAAGFTAAADGQILVRRAASTDRDALSQLFARCTLQTRYRRFHAPVKAIPERYLTEALAASPFHYALVACPVPPDTDLIGTDLAAARDMDARSGGIVALASCRVVDEGMAEVGILIEDTWQRRGVGSALLDELAAHARAIGLRALTAQLLTEQAWTAGMLARYGPIQRSLTSRGVVTVTVRLTPGDAPREAPAGPRLSCRPAATRSASA